MSIHNDCLLTITADEQISKFSNTHILGKYLQLSRIEDKFLKQMLPKIPVFRLITEFNNSGISVLVNHSGGLALPLNKIPFEKSFCIET